MILIRIIIFCFLIIYARANFLSSKPGGGKYKYQRKIDETNAPSLISCSLHCRVVDADAEAVFEKNACTCFKRSHNTNENKKETMSTSGIIVKKIKRWNRIVFVDNYEIEITRNNLLPIIVPKLSKEYTVSVDVKPTSYMNGNDISSVFHMTASGNLGTYDSRIPAIAFTGYKLDTFSSAVNSHIAYGYQVRSNERYPLNQWIYIRFTQEKEGSGKYRYTVTINGKIFSSVINDVPAEIFNVRCYMSNPWGTPQPGFIRNAWVDVYNE